MGFGPKIAQSHFSILDRGEASLELDSKFENKVNKDRFPEIATDEDKTFVKLAAPEKEIEVNPVYSDENPRQSRVETVFVTERRLAQDWEIRELTSGTTIVTRSMNGIWFAREKASPLATY